MNSPSEAAKGFLVNAVNWAASGSDPGIVSLTDGWSGDPGNWWLNDDSFLRDELYGYVSYFQEESVVIPDATAAFPVNEGLTTASLSNWGTSSHSAFFKDGVPGYVSINDAGTHTGYSVTMVTADHAGGGTEGGDDPVSVPEPSTIFLLGCGLLSLFGLRKKN